MTTNIIHKTYGSHSTVWIREDWLVSELDIKHNSLRVRRAEHNKGLRSVWRYKRVEGCFYYDYENLPKSKQKKLPTKQDLIGIAGENMSREEILAGAKEKIHVLYGEYGEYREQELGASRYYIDNGYNRDSMELSSCVVWANILMDYTDKETRRWVLLGLDKIMDVYEAMLCVIEEKSLKYWKVSSVKAMYNKFKGYREKTKEEKYRFFIHKNMGNKHRQLLDDEVKNAIVWLRGMGQNWSDRSISRKIQFCCELKGWAVPSERTITEYMNTKQVKIWTEVGRYGAKGGKFARYVKSSVSIALPLYAGDCWQVDGTRVNMIPHVTLNDEGKKVERYLYYVIIKDVYSGAILGHGYTYSENHAVVIDALREAVDSTGHLPYELVCDKFPGHNTKEWQYLEGELERLGVRVTRAYKAEGKAQIERGFRVIQDVFMSESIFYYGEGIRSSRKSSHRSNEYLQAVKKMRKKIGWDFDRACEEMDMVIDRYNNTKLSNYSKRNIDKSPRELHNESDKSNVLRLEKARLMWLFAIRKELTLGGAGLLRTAIAGNEYSYRMNNYKAIEQHDKVLLLCDYRNMDTAMVFDFEGNLLEAVQEIGEVRIHGPNAHTEKLNRERKRINAYRNYAIAGYEKISGSAIEEIGEVDLLTPLTTKKQAIEAAETKMLEDVNKSFESLPEGEEDETIEAKIANPLGGLWKSE